MRLPDLSRLGDLLSAKPRTPVIGIDFGSKQLKLLQLDGAEPPNLLAAAAIEVPDQLAIGDGFKRLDWQMAQLPGLLKAGGFKGRRAAVCVPGGMCYCKHLQLSLPEVGASDIVAAAIAEQLICDPAALVVRHRIAAVGTGGRSEVIAMAVGRGLVTRLINGLKPAGLDLVALHPESFATLRSFDNVTRRDGDVELASLYLDIGASSTRVIIAHGREPVFIKNVNIGGHTLDQLVAERARCSLAEARTKRSEAFLAPAGNPLAPVATDNLDKPLFNTADRPSPATVTGALDTPGTGVQVGDALGDVKTQADTPITAVLERRSTLAPKGFAQVPDAGEQRPIHDAVEGLADEVAMCLRYHSNLFPGKRVDRCYFVGGESSVGGMAAFVAKKLKMTAHIADPLARIGRSAKQTTPNVDLARAQPGWAAVVGLCCGPTDM